MQENISTFIFNQSCDQFDGTAAVGYSNGVEVFAKKMGMGGRAEFYDAEMAGGGG